jgi:hypothetical protein
MFGHVIYVILIIIISSQLHVDVPICVFLLRFPTETQYTFLPERFTNRTGGWNIRFRYSVKLGNKRKYALLSRLVHQLVTKSVTSTFMHKRNKLNLSPVAKWLRHFDTNRKVAGSIPDKAIFFFKFTRSLLTLSPFLGHTRNYGSRKLNENDVKIIVQLAFS